MKRKIAKIGMWTMFVASFGLIVLGILYMALWHNYGIGGGHFIWAFVAVIQALSLQNQEEVMSENEKLERLLKLATETSLNEAKKNSKLIAERDEYRDLAEKNKNMYIELKEKQYENEREQEQLLNVAANVMHAYIIAKGISAEFKMYGPNGMEDPFPDCCINVAKSIIEKSK